MKKHIKQVEGFDIYFEALEEDQINFDGWDAKCEKQTRKGLNNGSLVCFCAKVTAEKAWIELGSDYLGQCIYKSEEEFYTTKDDYFDDMVLMVVDEAKKNLPDIIAELSK